MGINDILILLANWGACPVSGFAPPFTLDQELTDACLDKEDDWDPYVAVMQDDGESQATKDRWDCWMRHYLLDCNKCTCPPSHHSACQGQDPFN